MNTIMQSTLRKILYDAYRRECEANNVDPSLNVIRWIQHTKSFTDFSFLLAPSRLGEDPHKNGTAASPPNFSEGGNKLRSKDTAVTVHSDANSISVVGRSGATGASFPSTQSADQSNSQLHSKYTENTTTHMAGHLNGEKASSDLPLLSAQLTQAKQYFSRTKRFVLNPADTTALRKLNAIKAFLRLIPTITTVGFQFCGLMPNIVSHVIDFVAETCEAQSHGRVLDENGIGEVDNQSRGSPFSEIFSKVAKATGMGSADGTLFCVDLRGNKLTIMEFRRLCQLVMKYPQLKEVFVDPSDFYPVDVLAELCEKNAQAASVINSTKRSGEGDPKSTSEAKNTSDLLTDGHHIDDKLRVTRLSPRAWVSQEEVDTFERTFFPLESTFSAISDAITQGSALSTGISALFFQFILSDIVLTIKNAVSRATLALASDDPFGGFGRTQEPVVIDFSDTLRTSFDRFTFWRRGRPAQESLFHSPIPNERATALCCVCGGYCDGFDPLNVNSAIGNGEKGSDKRQSPRSAKATDAATGSQYGTHRQLQDENDGDYFDYDTRGNANNRSKTVEDGGSSNNEELGHTAANNSFILVLARALFSPPSAISNSSNGSSRQENVNNYTYESKKSTSRVAERYEGEGETANTQPLRTLKWLYEYTVSVVEISTEAFVMSDEDRENLLESMANYKAGAALADSPRRVASIGKENKQRSMPSSGDPSQKKSDHQGPHNVALPFGDFILEPPRVRSSPCAQKCSILLSCRAAGVAVGLLSVDECKHAIKTVPLPNVVDIIEEADITFKHPHTWPPFEELFFTQDNNNNNNSNNTKCSNDYAGATNSSTSAVRTVIVDDKGDDIVADLTTDIERYYGGNAGSGALVSTRTLDARESKKTKSSLIAGPWYNGCARDAYTAENLSAEQTTATPLDHLDVVTHALAYLADESNHWGRKHTEAHAIGSSCVERCKNVSSSRERVLNQLLTSGIASFTPNLVKNANRNAAINNNNNNNNNNTAVRHEYDTVLKVKEGQTRGTSAQSGPRTSKLNAFVGLEGSSLLSACQKTVLNLPEYSSWCDVLQRSNDPSTLVSSFDLIAFYLSFVRNRTNGPIRGSSVAFGFELPISYIFGHSDLKNKNSSSVLSRHCENANGNPTSHPHIVRHESYELGSLSFPTVALLHSVCSYKGVRMICGTAPDGRQLLFTRDAVNEFATRYDAVAYVNIDDYHVQLGVSRKQTLNIRKARLLHARSALAIDKTEDDVHDRMKKINNDNDDNNDDVDCQRESALIDGILRPDVIRGISNIPLSILDKSFEAETLIRVLLLLMAGVNVGGCAATNSDESNQNNEVQSDVSATARSSSSSHMSDALIFSAHHFYPSEQIADFVQKLLLAQELIEPACRREALKNGETYSPCLNTEQIRSLSRAREAFIQSDDNNDLLPKLGDENLLDIARRVLVSIFVKEKPESFLWELAVPSTTINYLTSFLQMWEEAHKSPHSSSFFNAAAAADVGGLDVYDLMIAKRFPFDLKMFSRQSYLGKGGQATTASLQAPLCNLKETADDDDDDGMVHLAKCCVISVRQLRLGLQAYRLGSVSEIVSWAAHVPANFLNAFVLCINRLHGQLTPIINQTVHPSLASSLIRTVRAQVEYKKEGEKRDEQRDDNEFPSSLPRDSSLGIVFPKLESHRRVILTEASVSTSGLFETFANPDCLIAADDDDNDYSIGTVSKEMIKKELKRKGGRPALRLFSDDDYPEPFIIIDVGFELAVARMDIDLSFTGGNLSKKTKNQAQLTREAILVRQRRQNDSAAHLPNPTIVAAPSNPNNNNTQSLASGINTSSQLHATLNVDGNPRNRMPHNTSPSLSPNASLSAAVAFKGGSRAQSPKLTHARGTDINTNVNTPSGGRKLLVAAANKAEEAEGLGKNDNSNNYNPLNNLLDSSAASVPKASNTDNEKGNKKPNHDLSDETRPNQITADPPATATEKPTDFSNTLSVTSPTRQRSLSQTRLTAGAFTPRPKGPISLADASAQNISLTLGNSEEPPVRRSSRINSIFNSESFEPPPNEGEEEYLFDADLEFNGVATVVVEASQDGRRFERFSDFPIMIGNQISQSLTLPFVGAYRYWKLVWVNVPRVFTDSEGKDNFEACPHVTQIKVFAHNRSLSESCSGSVKGSLVKGALLGDTFGDKCGPIFAFPLRESGSHSNGRPTHHLRHLLCFRNQRRIANSEKIVEQLIGTLVDDSFDSYDFLARTFGVFTTKLTRGEETIDDGLLKINSRKESTRIFLLEERYGYWSTLARLGHVPTAAITTTKWKSVYLISKTGSNQYVSRCDKHTGVLLDPPMSIEEHPVFSALPFPFINEIGGSFPISDSIVLIYSGFVFTLFDLTFNRAIIPTQSWHSNIPGRPIIEKNGYGNYKEIPPVANLFCFPFRYVSLIIPDFSSTSDILLISGADAIRWRLPAVEDIVMYYHSPLWRISDANPRFGVPDCVLTAEAAPYLVSTTFVDDLVNSIIPIRDFEFPNIANLCVTFVADRSSFGPNQSSVSEDSRVFKFISGSDLTSFNSLAAVNSNDTPFVVSPQIIYGDSDTGSLGVAVSNSKPNESHCEVLFNISERQSLSAILLVGTVSGCRLILEALPSSLEWPPKSLSLSSNPAIEFNNGRRHNRPSKLTRQSDGAVETASVNAQAFSSTGRSTAMRGASGANGDWTFVSRASVKDFVTVIPIPITTFPSSMFRIRTEFPTNRLAIHRILLAKRKFKTAGIGLDRNQLDKSEPKNASCPQKKLEMSALSSKSDYDVPLVESREDLKPPPIALAPFVLFPVSPIPVVDGKARIVLTTAPEETMVKGVRLHLSRTLSTSEIEELLHACAMQNSGNALNSPPTSPLSFSAPLRETLAISPSLVVTLPNSSQLTVSISRDAAIFTPIKTTLSQIEGLDCPSLDVLFDLPVTARVVAVAITHRITGVGCIEKLTTGCSVLLATFTVLTLAAGPFVSSATTSGTSDTPQSMSLTTNSDELSGKGLSPIANFVPCRENAFHVPLPAGYQSCITRVIAHLHFSTHAASASNSLVSTMSCGSIRPQNPPPQECSVTIHKGEKNFGSYVEDDYKNADVGRSHNECTRNRKQIGSQVVRLDGKAELDITFNPDALGYEGTSSLVFVLSNPHTSLENISVWSPQFPTAIHIDLDGSSSSTRIAKSNKDVEGDQTEPHRIPAVDATTTANTSKFQHALLSVNHQCISQFNPIGLRISVLALFSAWQASNTSDDQTTLEQHSWKTLVREIRVYGFAVSETHGVWTVSGTSYSRIELYRRSNIEEVSSVEDLRILFSDYISHHPADITYDFVELHIEWNRDPTSTDVAFFKSLIAHHTYLLVNPALNASALDRAHILSKSQMSETLRATVSFAGNEAIIAHAGEPIQLNLQAGARVRFSSRDFNHPLLFSGVSIEIVGSNFPDDGWTDKDSATFAVECISSSNEYATVVGYVRTESKQPLVWIGDGSRNGIPPTAWQIIMCSHSKENTSEIEEYYQTTRSDFARLHGKSANTTSPSVTVRVRFYACPLRSQTAPFALSLSNANFTTNVLGKQIMADEHNFLLSQIHAQTPFGPAESRALDLLAVEGVVEIRKSNASVLGANSVKGIMNNTQGQETEMRSVAGGTPATTVLYVGTYIKGEPQAFTKISICTLTDANHEFAIQYSDDGNNFTTVAIHAQREGWCTTRWRFCGFHSYWRVAASLLPGSVAVKRARKSTASSASFNQDNDDRILGALMQNVNPSALSSIHWFTALPPTLVDTPDPMQFYNRLIGQAQVQNKLRIPQHDTTLLLAFPIGFGTPQRQASVEPKKVDYGTSNIAQTLALEEEVKIQQAMMRVVHGKVSSLALRSATQLEERIDEMLPLVEDLFLALDKSEADRLRSQLRVSSKLTLENTQLFSGITPESGMPYITACGIVSSDVFNARSKRVSVRFQLTCPSMSLSNNPRVSPQAVICVESINTENIFKQSVLERALSDLIDPDSPRTFEALMAAFDWAVGYHLPVDRGAPKKMSRSEQALGFSRTPALLIRSSFDTMFGSTAGAFYLPSGKVINSLFEVAIRSGNSVLVRCNSFAEVLRFFRQEVPRSFLEKEEPRVMQAFSRAEDEVLAKKKKSSDAEFEDDSRFHTLDSPDFFTSIPCPSNQTTTSLSSGLLRIITTLATPIDDVNIVVSWEPKSYSPRVVASFTLPSRSIDGLVSLRPVLFSVVYLIDEKSVSITADTAIVLSRVSLSTTLAARFATSTNGDTFNFPRLLHGAFQSVSDVEKGFCPDHPAVMCGHVTFDTQTRRMTSIGAYGVMIESLASLTPYGQSWSYQVFAPGLNPRDVGIHHEGLADDLQLLGMSASKILLPDPSTVKFKFSSFRRNHPPLSTSDSGSFFGSASNSNNLLSRGTCVWNGRLYKCSLSIQTGCTTLTFSSDSEGSSTELFGSLRLEGAGSRVVKITNMPSSSWTIECKSDRESIRVKRFSAERARVESLVFDQHSPPVSIRSSSLTTCDAGMDIGNVNHSDWKIQWVFPKKVLVMLLGKIEAELSKFKPSEVGNKSSLSKSYRVEIGYLQMVGFENPYLKVSGTINDELFSFLLDPQHFIIPQIMDQLKITHPRIFF